MKRNFLEPQKALWRTISSDSIKAEAHRLIEGLPADATWDDLPYEIFVRQKIEAGLADAKAGRTVAHGDVQRQFGHQAT